MGFSFKNLKNKIKVNFKNYKKFTLIIYMYWALFWW